jgi:protein ImuB
LQTDARKLPESQDLHRAHHRDLEPGSSGQRWQVTRHPRSRSSGPAKSIFGESVWGPFVLYALAPRGALKVVACSRRAALAGVTAGQTLAEAQALVPGLEAELHNPRADRAALEELAVWCEQFSPLVGVELTSQPARSTAGASDAEHAQTDHLFLDVTGLAALFGDEQGLTDRVQRAFAERGLLVRLGLADSLGAAWGVAHYGARVMGEHPQPVIIPVGATAAALAPLPLAALRLEEPTITLLHELGVLQVGQLLALPRASLAARFDPHLIRRLDQALGVIPETIVAQQPPPEWECEWPFEYPVQQQAMLEWSLRQLVEQLGKLLTARGRGAVRLACDFYCEGAIEPLRLSVGLYRPSATPQHLWELLAMQLERLSLATPVTRIKLSVLLAVPIRAWQRDLFADNQQQNAQHLGLLVDRLSSRMGAAAVLRPSLLADAQPEYAYRYAPLAGGVATSPGTSQRTPSARRQTARLQTANTETHARLPERPLRLEPRPVLLEVTRVADGPPMQFYWQGELHRLARSWGPERIQTGWWRGQTIRRDYYRVETTSGTRFWLFRQREGRWFLHGVFD